jgi:hypothetical protein
MEKNMSGIQPQALTDKELLQAGYILWNDELGMPIVFQKELLKRYARWIEEAQFKETYVQPEQLRLFE